MAGFKISKGLLIGVLVAAFFGISLLYRVAIPYDKIFINDWIKFSSNDVYYFMRLVDSLASNFPNLTQFDPYFIFPGGTPAGSIPFFHWLMAAVIWIVGLGSPTQHTIDIVGVYFPAIFGALTVVPVFFLGKALFNRWAGVLAAGLSAVFGGEFMGRTILGGGDTPVAEVFFTTVGMLFLVLAVKTAGERQLTFSHILKFDRKTIGRPLVFSVLAGLFLGFYLATWLGALLFIFIISVYFILQFIANHLHRKSSDHLGITGFIALLIAFIIFLPNAHGTDLLFTMAIGTLLPAVLAIVSRTMSGDKFKPVFYPAVIVAAGAIALFIINAAAPDIFDAMLGKFNFVFFPLGSTAATTLEMQPFLTPQGNFSTLVAWGNFTTSFFMFKNVPIPGFALIALSVLIYLAARGQKSNRRWYIAVGWVLTALITLMALVLLTTYQDARYFAVLPLALLLFLIFKQRDCDEHMSLFFVWTLIILIATLAQRRFAYYLVINISLLTAYLSWQAIWQAGLKKAAAAPEPTVVLRKTAAKITQQKNARKKKMTTVYQINAVLAIIVVFVLAFLFNILSSRTTAANVSFAPTDAWQSSMLWMRDNTPEPLGDSQAYYKLHPLTPPFEYPSTAYGVTAWWDYGYWITHIAHRIPNANPSQQPDPITRIANFFLSRDEIAARQLLQQMGSRYVVLDYTTTTSKYWAVAQWAGQPQTGLFEFYGVQDNARIFGKQFYYPEYYQTTAVRLYNFDGEAVTDVTATVITFSEQRDNNGNIFKLITETKEFKDYQEALVYVQTAGPANHRLVGVNPFISPVPLEPVKDYTRVYVSTETATHQDISMLPELSISVFTTGEVKIFQYDPQQ